MALKYLTLDEMIDLSHAWVNPQNDAHRCIARQAKLSALLDDLARAHARLLEVPPPPESPQRDALAAEASAKDAEHDRLAGGIYGLLTALGQLDPQGAELLALRDTLMPEGLSKVVHGSYRAQAGNARRVRAQLNAELRAGLKRVHLRRGTLLDHVEAWLDAGEALGALEEQRSRLDAASVPGPGRALNDARNVWIRTVNALESLAALAELDADSERLVFGALREAEARAVQRSLRRRGAKEDVSGAPREPASADPASA